MMRVLTLILVSCVSIGSSATAQSDPKRTVRVRAQIVDSSGQPIEGVGITCGPSGGLRTTDALENPVARSDGQGRIDCGVSFPFETAGNINTRGFALFAKTGYSTTRVTTMTSPYFTAWGTQSTSQSNRDLGRIVMYPAGSLSGIVRGVDGRPLAGVRIVATELMFGGGITRFMGYGNYQHTYVSTADSDARGHFELDGVFADGMTLTVLAPGHYRKVVPFVSKGRAIDVAMEPGGFMSGKVVDGDGKPVDAQLYPSFECGTYYRNLAYQNPVRTGADGSFKLTILERGRYNIRAHLILKPGQTYRTAVSEIYSAPSSEIVIEMGGGDAVSAPITVTVVPKGSRKPVAGARAVVVWQDPRYLNEMVMEQAFSVGSRNLIGGKIELPGPVGSQTPKGAVLVKAKGFAPQVVKGIEYDPDEPPSIEVQMVEGGVIEGVVVDEAGKVLADAEVMLRRPGSRTVNYGWSGGVQRSSTETVAHTDSKGRFRVADLPDGYHEVGAFMSGRPRSKAARVKISGSKRRQTLRLLIRPGATLRGRVFLGHGPDGKKRSADLGRKNFRVRLAPRDTGSESVMFSGLSPFSSRSFLNEMPSRNQSTESVSELGQNGEFEFHGLAPGRYRFSLVAPSLGRRGNVVVTAIEPLRIRTESMQRDFDISEDLGGVVRGRVTMPAAKIEMSRICVLSQSVSNSGLAPRRLNFNSSFFRCMVGADGSFAFHASRGTHLIWLVDAVDAAVLYRHKELVEVRTNEDVQLAVEVPLALLRVRLRPENAAAGFLAGSLDLLATHPGEPEDQNFFRYVRGVGRPVEGRNDFLLRVPPVNIQVAVRSFFNTVDTSGGHGYFAIGEGSIVPEPGRLNTLTITVAPPAETSGLTDK